MELYLSALKRQLLPAAAMGVVYLAVLLTMIVICNSNSLIHYETAPYEYGSEPIDFFFGLIVSVPFAISTFFMKKNRFLDYVSVRMSQKEYLRSYIASALTACFMMVFVVNMVGVVFSCFVADLTTVPSGNDLTEYPWGSLQLNYPILFGVIWSVFKGLVGAALCLFAQLIALYVDNLFLALLAPYAYTILENFLTANIGLPEISLTTVIVLNRLTPSAMRPWNITAAIIIFLLVIRFTGKKLKEYDEQNC